MPYFCFIKDSEKFCNIEICLILVHHFPSLFDHRILFSPQNPPNKESDFGKYCPVQWVVYFDGDDDDGGDGGDNKDNSNIYWALIMS